jgi:formylglycine-generating enzyme required for sulfatase activity
MCVGLALAAGLVSARRQEPCAGLIEGLGAAQWRDREAAQARLRQEGTACWIDLMKALRFHPDLEVRLRVRSVVERLDPPGGMVRVPGGRVWVGGETARVARWNRRRQVELKAFEIDRFEVTVAQFRKFEEATGRSVSAARRHAGRDLGRPPGSPMVEVDFEEAAAFAAWAGKRLPTSEEWELAARGTDERLFPWGNELGTGKANVGTPDVALVGSHPEDVSPYGCYDLGGNLAEWTSGAGARPSTFLIRGAAFRTPLRPDEARLDYIVDETESVHRSDAVGFRCARDLR